MIGLLMMASCCTSDGAWGREDYKKQNISNQSYVEVLRQYNETPTVCKVYIQRAAEKGCMTYEEEDALYFCDGEELRRQIVQVR